MRVRVLLLNVIWRRPYSVTPQCFVTNMMWRCKTRKCPVFSCEQSVGGSLCVNNTGNIHSLILHCARTLYKWRHHTLTRAHWNTAKQNVPWPYGKKTFVSPHTEWLSHLITSAQRNLSQILNVSNDSFCWIKSFFIYPFVLSESRDINVSECLCDACVLCTQSLNLTWMRERRADWSIQNLAVKLIYCYTEYSVGLSMET